ncbi:MAG: hypothetical protein ACRDU0_04185, partial [Mycobacterium sp.]
VAGVSLEQFAAVSKGVAAFKYDQSKLVEIAASKGSTPSAGRPQQRAGMTGSSATPLSPVDAHVIEQGCCSRN